MIDETDLIALLAGLLKKEIDGAFVLANTVEEENNDIDEVTRYRRGSRKSS